MMHALKYPYLCPGCGKPPKNCTCIMCKPDPDTTEEDLSTDLN